MTIETGIENAGVYIDSLDDTYPVGGDDLLEGDNHIRGIKNTLLNTFPAITGAVTSTHTELNLLDGATVTTTEINYNDITTLGTVQASKTVTADANGNIKFDTSSAQKKIIFDDVSGGLYESWIFGNTSSGSVGLYDANNTRNVWIYNPSANTLTFSSTTAITASGGITADVTGNVTGDVSGSASQINGVTPSIFVPITSPSAQNVDFGASTAWANVALTALSGTGATSALIMFQRVTSVSSYSKFFYAREDGTADAQGLVTSVVELWDAAGASPHLTFTRSTKVINVVSEVIEMSQNNTTGITDVNVVVLGYWKDM